MVPRELSPYSNFIQENLKEFLVLLVLGAVAGYAYYYYLTRLPPESQVLEERGVLEMEGIVVNDFIHDRKGWQLKGVRAVVLEKSRRMLIDTVKIRIFSPHTQEKSKTFSDLTITADQGLIEWQDNRVTLKGNVVLVRADGSEMHTETAVYDAIKEFLTLPKPVRILSKGFTLKGSSLTYRIDEGVFLLNEPVMTGYD